MKLTFEVCQFCGKLPVDSKIRCDRDGTVNPDGSILFCSEDCRLTAIEIAEVGGEPA